MPGGRGRGEGEDARGRGGVVSFGAASGLLPGSSGPPPGGRAMQTSWPPSWALVRTWNGRLSATSTAELVEISVSRATNKSVARGTKKGQREGLGMIPHVKVSL